MKQNQETAANTNGSENSGSKRKMGCFTKILIVIGGIVLLFFISAMVSGIIEGVSNTDKEKSEKSAATDSSAELSRYIGGALQDMEQALNVKTKDMSEYRGYENVHRVKQNDDIIFECTVDAQNSIIKITLYNSGKKKYTLCGLNSKTSPKDADPILKEQGYTAVRDNIWMSSDQKDEIKYEEKKWIYEKDSSSLPDEILRSKAEADFKYQYEDSVGAAYIGNGQIVEYFHDSYAKMFYEYEKFTDYQKQILNDTYRGRFIKIQGTITAVSGNGTITVLCQDDKASEDAGLIWPMQGIADVTLVPEQTNELTLLKKDDNVLIFGQIDFSTYGRILNSFDVNNGILTAVGQNEIKVPFISSVSEGIYTYPSDYSKKAEQEKAADSLSVNSSDEAIEAVKAYGEKEGWSDPYDMFEAHEDGDVYIVLAGHSYMGDDWIEDAYTVDKNDKNNVGLAVN